MFTSNNFTPSVSRIAIHEADDAFWFLTESVARSLDAVAADVEERSSSAFDLIADVAGIVVVVAEESGDGAKLADATGAKEFADAEPLREAADHKGFADFDASALADVEKAFGFGHGEADGFFAKDVLAGFGGFRGPGNVKLIGERIVNGVDFRIGEELLVRAIGFGNVESGGGFSGFFEVARGDCGDGCESALLHGGQNFLEADVGGTQDSPAKLPRHAQILARTDDRVWPGECKPRLAWVPFRRRR